MPRRTKACAICRKKRIKCDATMPHCNMCKKYGRQCPGPTDAPLTFVDTSAYPSGKRPRKKPSPPNKQPASTGTVGPKPDAGSSKNLYPHPAVGTNDTELVIKLSSQVAYTNHARVSGRHVLNEALFANMTYFFCADGRTLPGAHGKPASWLNSLPRMSVQPYRSSSSLAKTDAKGRDVLSLAIRATTAAFGSLECRETGLLQYASGLYGDALRAQRRALLGNAGGWNDVSMDMVATSVILGMFEAIVATTERAFVEHIIGTAKMLDVAILRAAEMRAANQTKQAVPVDVAGGERKSTEGNDFGPVFTQIFFHTRRQLAFICLTAGDEHIRGDPVIRRFMEDACGWPFPLPLDQQVTRPLAILIRLNAEKEMDMTLVREFEDAREEVELLWARYEKSNHGPPLCWFDEKIGRLNFRDPITSLQYAQFSACHILISRLSTSISSMLSPSPASMVSYHLPVDLVLPLRPYYTNAHQTLGFPPTLQEPSASTAYADSPPSDDAPAPQPDHFSTILDVATYLKARNVGFSYLRLHLPLFLVAKHAPQLEQRITARETFEEWKRGTLRGIGLLALRGLSDG